MSTKPAPVFFSATSKRRLNGFCVFPPAISKKAERPGRAGGKLPLRRDRSCLGFAVFLGRWCWRPEGRRLLQLALFQMIMRCIRAIMRSLLRA